MANNRFFIENIRISCSSILGNRLRAILTITIIAIGIMALVGIITASEAIKSSITSSFSQAGAGSFSIERLWDYGSSDSKRRKRNSRITYDQAIKYKKYMADKAKVSLSIYVSGNNAIKYGSKKTNPNIRMIGIDEHFMESKGYDIEKGRNISASEIETQRPVAIIGTGVQEALFSANDQPIGKEISVSGKTFQVIGIKKKKGSSMGYNEDGVVYIPLTTASSIFSIPSPNYDINSIPFDASDVEASTSLATGIMRVVRLLRPTDAADFEITTNDYSSSRMLEQISMVVIAAYIIGFITLLGATVALMNIMLVSVNEKTREIGTRMALGAKKTVIKQQFLMESIIISQIGGMLGIVLGILVGNLITIVIGGSFIIPWNWIGIGFILCLAVGVLSGYLPAVRASRLDPIEALRYE